MFMENQRSQRISLFYQVLSGSKKNRCLWLELGPIWLLQDVRSGHGRFGKGIDQVGHGSCDGAQGAQNSRGALQRFLTVTSIEDRGPHRQKTRFHNGSDVIGTGYIQVLQAEAVKRRTNLRRVGSEIPEVHRVYSMDPTPLAEFFQSLPPVEVRIAKSHVSLHGSTPQFIGITKPLRPDTKSRKSDPAHPHNDCRFYAAFGPAGQGTGGFNNGSGHPHRIKRHYWQDQADPDLHVKKNAECQQNQTADEDSVGKTPSTQNQQDKGGEKQGQGHLDGERHREIEPDRLRIALPQQESAVPLGIVCNLPKDTIERIGKDQQVAGEPLHGLGPAIFSEGLGPLHE